MKKYIIINGKTIALKQFENIEKAVEYCENFCDHSKHVFYSEYDTIEGKH